MSVVSQTVTTTKQASNATLKRQNWTTISYTKNARPPTINNKGTIIDIGGGIVKKASNNSNSDQIPMDVQRRQGIIRLIYIFTKK